MTATQVEPVGFVVVSSTRDTIMGPTERPIFKTIERAREVADRWNNNVSPNGRGTYIVCALVPVDVELSDFHNPSNYHIK